MDSLKVELDESKLDAKYFSDSHKDVEAQCQKLE